LTGTPRNSDVYRLRTALTVTVTMVCTVLGLAVWTRVANAATPPAPATPSALPGPPPDAGSGLPLPPAPGQAPPAELDASPTTIPVTGSGPGLLSGTAGLKGTQVSLPIVCTAAGRVTMSTSGLGQLAQATYRCANGRGDVRLTLTKDAARQV
jgi:hypothetical protein